MALELRVNVDALGNLDDLFGALTDEEEALQHEGVLFSAKTKASPAFGAGMPEISELIISLGSAGVFTALVTVLVAYFKQRPAGTVTLKSTAGDRSITFTAENCDAAAISKNLKHILEASS
jgi:hypothetical protein